MFQEDKRKQKNYILVSQAISFFLLAMIILTALSLKEELLNQLNYEHTTIVLLTVICLLIASRFLSTHYNNVKAEAVINIFFLVVSAYFLICLNDPAFKLLLIMPIILTALKSGVRSALYTTLISLAVLFFVSYKNDFLTIDSDLMYAAIFLLLAWLLGNMRETESEIQRKLEKLANFDGLTDLYNHRSFQNIMDRELAEAQKEKSPLSLLLLDIDYFKVYNDSFGHPKGDLVLKQVARLLKESTPEDGYCARYGGEEFAIALPGKGTGTAKELGELIRNRVEDTVFPGMDVLPGGKLTISIGIAEYPLMAANKDKLIQKADEALYKAKFISKNKVETYYSVFDELSLDLYGEEQDIFNSIRTLTMVINAKDRYTYGHSERTMQMARDLAERLGLKPEKIKELVYSALLHDIGKIEISREILNKPEELNEEEWQILRCHPQWGADIIRPLKALSGTVQIVLHHHENYDGSGYPHNLKGEEIPYGARIMRIIDSFDAMTTNRAYKKGMSKKQAVKELERWSGLYYDPVILTEFIRMISKKE